MLQTKTVLSELQAKISEYDFKKVVNKYDGDKGIKAFSTKNLFTILIYCQIAAKQSLRDIVCSLRSKMNLWYHLGIKSLSRNNLSYAMKNRDQRIFQELFYHLLGKLNKKITGIRDKRFRFKMPLHIIDSTIIGLCLKIFPWAEFRSTKSGIRINTMFNPKGDIPEFINITPAKKHELTIIDEYPIKENSIYTFDRGLLDFDFLSKISNKRAFFVVRAKKNTKFKKIKRNIKKHKSIKADCIIKFSSLKSKDYPEKLRLVKYYDNEKNIVYTYLTNNFNLSAITIAKIYKARWDIELFFKWIKQNLKIKKFIGTSENAVKIQIWTALISYLLIQYIRFETGTKYSLLYAFRIIKANLTANYELLELLVDKYRPRLNLQDETFIQLKMEF